MIYRILKNFLNIFVFLIPSKKIRHKIRKVYLIFHILDNVIIYFFDLILPKFKNKYIFFSVPDFADNSKVLYEYYKKENSKYKRQLIWLYLDKKYKKNKLIEKSYYLYSLNGLLNLLTSKYIIVDHVNALHISPFRHILIQLWHGLQ